MDPNKIVAVIMDFAENPSKEMFEPVKGLWAGAVADGLLNKDSFHLAVFLAFDSWDEWQNAIHVQKLDDCPNTFWYGAAPSGVPETPLYSRKAQVPSMWPNPKHIMVAR